MDTDQLIAFAQALVRERSLSGAERGAAALVAAEMRRLSFDEVAIDANGSVVGVIHGRQPGPTILLDAHCDTVGLAAGAAWTHDPFAADLADGYLYGRGSADMKGALAAMVYGAAAVDRSRIAGRIGVSATVMEEVMEGVSLRLVMAALKPDFVVIGEATDLNLNHGGRGRAEIHLETIGRPAHSSSPQLGLNAVHAMLAVVAGVERLPLPVDPLLGPALLALTDIISDPYPGYSVIPSRCRVTYDRRLLPGETEAETLEPIRQLPTVSGAELKVRLAEGEHAAYTGAVLRGAKFFPAWALPADHEFVQKSVSGLRQAGLDPQLGAYQFCTNAAYSAGVAGVPTVGFGPAGEGDAHVVDERLAVSQLLAAARGYRGLVEAVLGL